MSTGIWDRIEQGFERALQHHDKEVARRAVMGAYSHLKACVEAGNAKIADLEKQLADAKAKPAGTADGDLETLASSIETTLGAPVSDPEPTPAS